MYLVRTYTYVRTPTKQHTILRNMILGKEEEEEEEDDDDDDDDDVMLFDLSSFLVLLFSSCVVLWPVASRKYTHSITLFCTRTIVVF